MGWDGGRGGGGGGREGGFYGFHPSLEILKDGMGRGRIIWI